MRIRSIELFPVALPFSHAGPATGFAGAVWSTLDHLVVRVDTDEGLTGWGEAFGFGSVPATFAFFERLVTPLAVGADATEHAALMDRLQRTLHLYGRHGVGCYALSGLDIALWDLAGKATGLPLRTLASTAGPDGAAGGDVLPAVPAYASLLRYGDPRVVTRATEAALAEGFGRFKLHETSLDCVAAARSAAGEGVELMVDVNCAWAPDEAAAMAARLGALGVSWLEEPVWPPEDAAALAGVRSASPVPIAAGENACTARELAALLDAGAVDVLQPSATKVGGVTEFLRAAGLADAAGVRLAPHSPYFGPGLAATLQLIAARPASAAVELFAVRLEADMYGGALQARRGEVPLPPGPGLGLDPDPDVLRRHRLDR